MHIASPFGIPLRIHWSYSLLVGGLMAWGFVKGGAPALGASAFLAVALSVSVVLHELGHALAARRFGIGTDNITLYPMGGVASLERMPEEPDQELVIALAGPAVNIALAAIGGWGWMLTDHRLALGFVLMNLFLGLSNLLPAFPMDGGRVLRALLAKRMGWLPASRLAVRVGRVFAWGFIVVGVWWGDFSLPLMGAFLHLALNSERERLVAMHWQQTTGRPPPWVGAAAWSLDPGKPFGLRPPQWLPPVR
ncbi:MAG: site-2 protease family protein [Myxococcota bacterium]